MKELIQRVGRGATVLLTVAMLSVAVIKAQGCKSDERMPPPTTAGPALEAPTAVPAEQPVDPVAPPDGVAAADAGTDTGADVGEPAAPVVMPREMFPATKSGGFAPRPQPQQQNAAPR